MKNHAQPLADAAKAIEDFGKALNEFPEFICNKCGGYCKPSKALKDNTAKLFTSDSIEMGGYVPIESGTAEMVDCLKCTSCGHSFIP